MGLNALTNLRMKVLKISRSSKLLSVFGTSKKEEIFLWFSAICNEKQAIQSLLKHRPRTIRPHALYLYTIAILTKHVFCSLGMFELSSLDKPTLAVWITNFSKLISKQLHWTGFSISLFVTTSHSTLRCWWLFAFLRVRWENQYHSHVCVFSAELKSGLV